MERVQRWREYRDGEREDKDRPTGTESTEMERARTKTDKHTDRKSTQIKRGRTETYRQTGR